MRQTASYPPVRLTRPGGDLEIGLLAAGGLQMNDLERHAVEKTRRRLILSLCLFTLLFATLAARLLWLAGSYENKTAATGYPITGDPQQRPVISDRNHVLLATHITGYTLGADARMITDGDAVASALSDILPDLNINRARRLFATNRPYIELKRGLSPRQYRRVLALGNPALKLQADDRRVYPQGALAAHVIGFTSADGRGLRGLERMIDEEFVPQAQLQAQLQAQPQTQHRQMHGTGDSKNHNKAGDVHRDIHNVIDNGRLTTTLDINIQHGVRAELLYGMEKFSAKNATAIIMDMRNGNILSMVSLPDFDPNHPASSAAYNRFNRATQGLYELGSVFKLFAAAMVLETGAVSAKDMFQTSTPLQINGKMIQDYHGQNRPLTVGEIVVHSSNIGAAQLALSVSPQTHRAFLDSLYLTMRPVFDLPETATPQLPNYWNDIQRVTTSFGYGMTVSPLQMIAAVSALINDGIFYPPRLIDDGVPVGERVISSKTSSQMRQMMHQVVRLGTARKAQLAGYPIIGKTGTAEKAIAGGYDKTKNITTFLSAFPAHKPVYAMIVMFDEPQPLPETYGRMTAGWNVVPVSARIIARIAPLLGILPMPDMEIAETDIELAATDIEIAVANNIATGLSTTDSLDRTDLPDTANTTDAANITDTENTTDKPVAPVAPAAPAAPVAPVAPDGTNTQDVTDLPDVAGSPDIATLPDVIMPHHPASMNGEAL